jgi:hypothetical protein
MWTLLAIVAALSIATGIIAIGYVWYQFRPLTDNERARLRQGN